MALFAGISVLALLAIVAWKSTGFLRDAGVSDTSQMVRVTTGYTGDPDAPNWQRPLQILGSSTSTASENTKSDPDGLSNIGGNVLETLVGSYVTMKDAGVYTPAQGKEIAETIAEGLRANIPYRLYNASEMKSDPDASLSRMLTYLSDMREALEPLLKNSTYELEIFAYYLDTKDIQYLEELKDLTKEYRAAAENAAKIVVPKDAIPHHIGILNALSEFAAVVEKLAANADDPFAAAALIRTFGDAETHMLTSFNALAGYFREHSKS